MSGIREFGADPDLKKLYHVYLAIVVFGGFIWWMVPLVVFILLSFPLWIGIVAALACFVPLLIAVGITVYWIPIFYSSISYIFEDVQITVIKGVWWKRKSFVPYNRITNLNIYQGPISRRFGLGKVSIQTAGFSGTSSGGGRVAEAEIFGIKNFDDVKETVMKYVRGMKPEAVEAEAEAPSKDTNLQILQELRKIREALERSLESLSLVKGA